MVISETAGAAGSSGSGSSAAGSSAAGSSAAGSSAGAGASVAGAAHWAANTDKTRASASSKDNFFNISSSSLEIVMERVSLKSHQFRLT
jgi:hypothetical protein